MDAGLSMLLALPFQSQKRLLFQLWNMVSWSKHDAHASAKLTKNLLVTPPVHSRQ